MGTGRKHLVLSTNVSQLLGEHKIGSSLGFTGPRLFESLVLNTNKQGVLGKTELCLVDDSVGMIGGNDIGRKQSEVTSERKEKGNWNKDDGPYQTSALRQENSQPLSCEDDSFRDADVACLVPQEQRQQHSALHVTDTRLCPLPTLVQLLTSLAVTGRLSSGPYSLKLPQPHQNPPED